MLGAGTQANPYIIQTPQDLQNIENNLSAYYELGNDIDMTNFGNFIPIGKASPYFTGFFDGKGHTISNLSITNSTAYNGLFARVENANSYIKNVKLENPSVTVSGTGGLNGTLVGKAISTVENCAIIGGTLSTGGGHNGGLIGYTLQSTVKNCHSSCNVTSTFDYIGGLVGVVDTTTIENCYATGTVKKSNNHGGLFALLSGTTTITSSYWDTETSGTTVSAGGTGKTTSEMKQQSTFTNWDFTSTWGIDGDYPYLQIFSSAQTGNKETIEVNSYMNPIQSKLNATKRKSISNNSHINKITSSVSRSKRSLKLADSFIYPIESNVTKTTRSFKTANYNVVGYISPITSSIQRKVKTYKDIKSYINSIQSTINVKYPTKIINAYSQILENKSNSVIVENRSTSNKIENPSMLEVV